MGNHLEKSAFEGKRLLHTGREHAAGAIQRV
jgi:hypothetical protein